MKKKIFKFNNDSWVDGHEDCSCCSGLTFEAYNSIDFQTNGTCSSIEECYVQVYLHLKGVDYMDVFDDKYNYLFEKSENELKKLVENQNAEIEII